MFKIVKYNCAPPQSKLDKFLSLFPRNFNLLIFIMIVKQGLAQDYTQRIEEGNIVRQKLSRLKLYRLRPHRFRL